MTYAYLKEYSRTTQKDGFYIDGPNWTLQTSFRADRFFRQSSYYNDDTRLPLTVVKTLVHLGEAKTGGHEPKEEILDWFPRLNPRYCNMDRKEIDELTGFIEERLDSKNFNQEGFSKLDKFLRNQTPLDPPY